MIRARARGDSWASSKVELYAWVEPVTTTVTTTTRTTTASTTTNTERQALKKAVLDGATRLIEAQVVALQAKLDAMSAGADEDHSRMKLQFEALEAALKDRADENSALKTRVNELERSLNLFASPLIEDMEPPDTSPRCKAAAAAAALSGVQCTPEVSADGAQLALSACCGDVQFSSKQCTVNPCDLKRDVDAIKRKFQPGE